MRSAPTYNRSASTALVGTHNPVGADPRAGTGPFPRPRALVLPMVKFGQSKPDGLGYVDTVDSDLMYHQYRLSLLQWNPGRAGTPPISLRRPVVSIMRLFFKKPVVMFRTSPISSLHTLATRTSPPCSTRTPSSPTQWFSPSGRATSKGTWCMVLLIVRGLLRRPSLSGTPTVTLCSVQIHSVVAKKRDASTDLLRRLHGYMTQHNVDFIGGDFNMSAFSTVGDVFSDPEFSAPAKSFRWGLGELEESNRECTGFLIMPKRPYDWRVDPHGCYNSITLHLALDPETKPLTFLCFCTFAPPTYLAPTASCAVSKHCKEGLSADITNMTV